MPPPSGEMSHREASRRKETALAQLREVELAQRRGALVDKRQIDSALTGIAATIRQALERLPDTLAPRLAAEADEARIATFLADELERVLADLAHDLKEITHEQAPTP